MAAQGVGDSSAQADANASLAARKRVTAAKPQGGSSAQADAGASPAALPPLTVLTFATAAYVRWLVRLHSNLRLLALPAVTLSVCAGDHISQQVKRCTDTCVPGASPYCTYGLGVPASCVLYVPVRGAGQLARRPCTVRTGYAHQPRECRMYRVPLHHRRHVLCASPRSTLVWV